MGMLVLATGIAGVAGTLAFVLMGAGIGGLTGLADYLFERWDRILH